MTKTPSQTPASKSEEEYGPAPPRDKIKAAHDDPSVQSGKASESHPKVPGSVKKRSDGAEYTWHYVEENHKKKSGK